MDILQLKYFVSAASIRNFTLASIENNISQSSFSKQIMNLENELGIELFVRKKRNIVLTSAGEEFLEYALRMLSTYEEMLRGMESYSEFQTLPVSIASIPVMQPYALVDIIFEMKDCYSDIMFSISERAESTEVLHLLHKGECDFAVLRTDFLNRAKYDIYPVVKDRLVAVIPHNHSLYNRDVIQLSELKNSKFVMSPDRTDLRMISQNACIAHGFYPEIVYITSGNINITLDVITRQGVVYLAFEKVIQHVIKEGMPCKFVPLEEQIESNAAFVALRERSTTKACKKVAKFLEERYGKEE